MAARSIRYIVKQHNKQHQIADEPVYMGELDFTMLFADRLTEMQAGAVVIMMMVALL